MDKVNDSKYEFYSLWLYSRNYHNQFLEILNLYEAGFYRPAFNLYYQLFENIVRSYLNGWEIRNTKKLFTLLSDILKLTELERNSLNGSEESLREVRNIIIHKDISVFHYEINGVLYSFADKETYKFIFDDFYPLVDNCISKILFNLNLGMIDDDGEPNEEA